MRNAVLFLMSLVCCGPSSAASHFAELEKGPHDVGLRVVREYDHTRVFRDAYDDVSGLPLSGERARPLQMLIWYPAEKGGNPLRYADYLETEASDTTFERDAGAVASFMATRTGRAEAALGKEAAARVLAQPMWAVANAPPLAGKHPVVVYGPGVGGAAHEAADLAEYLASHGYIVLASRSLGTRSRRMNADRDGIASQMRDLHFLVAHARSMPEADTDRIAAAGWSWGGMVNLFAAASDGRIGAVVSLDGTREPEFTRQIPRTHLAVPWLYLSRRPPTIPELNTAGIDTSFSLLNEAIYADVHQVVLHPMQHADFSSDALRFAPADHFDEYSRAEVEAAYRWMARYVLEFLNGYLKGVEAGRAFLEARPTQLGAPAHSITVRHTPPTRPVPTRSGLAQALAQQGFARAEEVYGALRRQEPGFQLTAQDVNQWGYDLMARPGRIGDAIEIFRFGTRVYPDDANLFDSLGEACENGKDPARAMQSYRRSLELNPSNRHAAERLQVLDAAKTPGRSR